MADDLAQQPAKLSKADVIARLRQASEAVKLRGESPYRARAYEMGAEALEENADDIVQTVAAGRLKEIRGIGDSLANTITDLVRTGRSPAIDAIMGDLPPGMLELNGIPGLTPHRIKRLHDELGVASLSDLRQALNSGVVGKLRGFGPQTVARLQATLDGPAAPPQTTQLLSDAQIMARRLLAHLRLSNRVDSSEIAGAVRRAVDTVDELDLVAASMSVDEVVASFQQHPAVARLESRSADVFRFRLTNGMPLNLTVTSRDRFGMALVRATGSSAHVTRLAAHAVLQEIDVDALVAPHEAVIYEKLGLPFIPPELREDAGEWEAVAAGDDFGDLLTVADNRGLVHCHTTHSDGRSTVEEMAKAARAMGMSYMTITDHSPRAFYAHGVEAERLPAQWSEIAAAQEAVGGEETIALLRGTESDILEDGSLDYDIDLLDRLQVVIASIHERHKMDGPTMTRRLVRAMEQPLFKIWGHPLGRLLLKRDPIACDVEAVLDAAARSPAAIEINGSPHRLDLPVEWIRAARKRGLKFVVSVDAHSTAELDYLGYGVSQARRAGVRRQEVLNTLSVDEFRAAVSPAATKHAI